MLHKPSLAMQGCGDIYPHDSSPGAMDCGDGSVDLFDIQEGIDIFLGKVVPSNCQLIQGDIPNGMPPSHCGNPAGNPNCETDGDIDTFDVLVMVDMALGKANCCDQCFSEIECYLHEDCNDGNECTDDTCNNNLCTTFCNATTFDDPCCTDSACYSEYICADNVSCILKPEDALVTHTKGGFEVLLSLENHNDPARSLQIDICETANGSPVDCLECAGCSTTDRAIDFSCFANELSNGCCRVMLSNFGTSVINAGTGSIISVDYSFVESCPFTACVNLTPFNTLVADTNNIQTSSAGKSGEVCFADFDSDGILNDEDNCPGTPNPDQIDTYPPEGNTCGDACECDGNFDGDENQDGTDAFTFRVDFGRNSYENPCGSNNPCNGNFDCDDNVDGSDAFTFKEDFGRGEYNNPCPACVREELCY